MARLAAMLMVRLASNERVASGAGAIGFENAPSIAWMPPWTRSAKPGLGEARRVAARRGGGNAGRRHDVGDRQEAALGEQVSDDFGALTLAHGPLPFPRNLLVDCR